MKVKVKRISNAPQLYGYSVYVPNPNAGDGTFAKVCEHDGLIGLLRADLPIVKGNYLHLCAGQVYGKRDAVLNHINRTHMVPPGGVIALCSHTSDEASYWSRFEFGFIKLRHFKEA